MIDATIDTDGLIRVHPQSTANLRVIRGDDGTLTVINLGNWPAIMNGEGVHRYGQDRFYLAPGKRHRFDVAETAGAGR